MFVAQWTATKYHTFLAEGQVAVSVSAETLEELWAALADEAAQYQKTNNHLIKHENFFLQNGFGVQKEVVGRLCLSVFED